MQTNQYFIIWNHGFKYIEKILDIIRDHPQIKIQRIFRRKIDDLDKFIDHIYKLDEASYSHIQKKSKYLKKIGNEIYIIFIKDINTEYKYKNQHKYSYNETYLKWYIRLLFNPKTSDKEINITEELINNGIKSAKNWPPFLTHDHIIHSSDIEEETQLVKDYFNLNKISSFSLNGNDYFGVKKTIKEINISDIVCNIANDDCKTIKKYISVIDTPHYKYLLGNYKNEYNKYILDNLGKIITCDNMSGSYDKLIMDFNYGKVIENEPSYIICKYIPKIKKYQIIDGLHRTCILIKNNIQKINIYIV
jgi:hypothetical protein